MSYNDRDLWGKFFRVGVALWLTCGSLGAAAFTVTPGSIASGSSDAFTVSVVGLTNQQSVLIEEFRDSNGNGVIDPGEELLLSLKVADGQAALFPPSPGLGQAGDEDGAINGQIRKGLTLPILPESLRAAGSYVFRVSALGGSFAAMSQPFVILPGAYSQAVEGRVLAGGIPVPSAMVALLDASGHDARLVTAAWSDAAGFFSLKAPPNNYLVLALKSGYLGNVGHGPVVSLGSGINSTQDVVLLPANSSISGQVTDGVTSNGIPGLQLFVESEAGFVALSITDTQGNFVVPVTPGIWRVETSELAGALMDYGNRSITVDATAGNVTGVKLALTHSRGSFQLVFFFPPSSFGGGTSGSVSFPTRLQYYYALYNLQAINYPTNVLFTGPAGSGLAGTPSAVFGGSYDGGSAFYSSPQITVPVYPPGGSYEVNYKGVAQPFVLPNPDAENRQVILRPVAVLNAAGNLTEMQWTYRNTSGSLTNPPSFIASIQIRIDGIGGRLYDGNISPGQTNHLLSFPVVWTNVSSVQMVYDDTLGNQYVKFWNRQDQPLQNVSGPLPPATLGVQFHYLFVAAGGASPYSWSMPAGSLPSGMTFTPVTGEINGSPTAIGLFPFTVRVTDRRGEIVDTVTTLRVTGGAGLRLESRPMPGPGGFGLSFFGEAGRSYSLEYSLTLTNWFTILTTNSPGGQIDLVDPTATNQFRYYRLRLNPQP